MIYTLA
jgi:hypothetical protein